MTLSLPSLCTTPIQQNHHGNLKRNYPRSQRNSFEVNSLKTKYVKSLTLTVFHQLIVCILLPWTPLLQLTQTKKYVQDRDKQMVVVQRVLSNITEPLYSLHDALSLETQLPVEEIKCI